MNFHNINISIFLNQLLHEEKNDKKNKTIFYPSRENRHERNSEFVTNIKLHSYYVHAIENVYINQTQ